MTEEKDQKKIKELEKYGEESKRLPEIEAEGEFGQAKEPRLEPEAEEDQEKRETKEPQASQAEKAIRREELNLPAGQPPFPPPSTASTLSTKSPTFQAVEGILEESLGDIFFELDEAHRREFKSIGEQTASRIVSMIEGSKAAAAKIFELIKRWLRIIPGINKYFLEQEAKIKTDKIMKLTEKP